jgi:hypothetical protein
MKKYLIIQLLFSTLLGLEGRIFAQDSSSTKAAKFDFPKDILYFEIGGNAVWMSFNYERSIGKGFFIRTGVGFTIVSNLPDSSDIGVPIIYAPVILLMCENIVSVSKNFSIDIGLGFNVLTDPRYRRLWLFQKEGANSLFLFTGRVGVRYLPYDGGFTIGLAATPYFSFFPLAATGFFGLYLGHAF